MSWAVVVLCGSEMSWGRWETVDENLVEVGLREERRG